MNKYEIIKDIGVGTFGTVYEAINKITNEKVAIKKLKEKINSWENCMNQNEVYFLRKLNHPNVVKLLEVIREKNDDVSLVFEFCDCNLYDLIKSHRRKQMQISESQIHNIIYSITSGLSYIHSNHIMHRDLKPENILIRDNEIKIADFGTAKEIPEYNQYNDMNSLTDYICTRWYRAPECVLKSKYYNEKVDIWALGCIMAELYNLRPIFPGRSEFDQIEIIFKILGTPKNGEWDIGLELMDKLGMMPKQYRGIDLRQLFNDIPEDALNFMKLIFQYDDNKRPSTQELLNHPYLKNYNNGINIKNNFNKPINTHRKINRDFSNFIFLKNENLNNFNYNNNNYKENPNPKYNYILPEIKQNNINNGTNSKFSIAYHRNNSYRMNENKFYTNKNKNINLQNYFFNNRFRSVFSDQQNNNFNSNSFVFSNYLKNNKPNLPNNDISIHNQFSTMVNNEIMNRKNIFFEKYENKYNNDKNNKETVFNNYGEKNNYILPKMRRLKSNYFLNDKFKNFGYNYFPDGNYRSIFSIK